MSENAPRDELAQRIRTLEAERLRPVPGPPLPTRQPKNGAERDAARRQRATVEAIRDLIRALHGDENDHQESP